MESDKDDGAQVESEQWLPDSGEWKGRSRGKKTNIGQQLLSCSWTAERSSLVLLHSRVTTDNNNTLSISKKLEGKVLRVFDT